MRSLLRTVFKIIMLAALTTGHAAEAVEITTDLGRFGEVTTWLITRTPEARLEVDPFEAMGGEAKLAAMGDPKLIRLAGHPLALADPAKPGRHSTARVDIAASCAADAAGR